MKKILLGILLLSFGFAKINIVSSTTDLADIAKTIGGDRVNVISIASGNQDPHYVEVLPSYMMKVKRADIYLKVGLELDMWANQIIDGSRNRNLVIVNCAENIVPMEVPANKVDASMGDIHQLGNPHYWLDPENGKIIAENILGALVSADPEGRELFQSNFNSFINAIDESTNKWLNEFESLNGKKMIFYHNSWPYFNSLFGIEAVQFVEPKPGIMPSPNHLEKLLHVINNDNIKVLGMESYFSDKAPKYLSGKTGIKIVHLAQSVKSLPGTDDYLKMIEYNLRTIADAFGENND